MIPVIWWFIINLMIGITTSAGLVITYGYNGEGLRRLKT